MKISVIPISKPTPENTDSKQAIHLHPIVPVYLTTGPESAHSWTGGVVFAGTHKSGCPIEGDAHRSCEEKKTNASPRSTLSFITIIKTSPFSVSTRDRRARETDPRRVKRSRRCFSFSPDLRFLPYQRSTDGWSQQWLPTTNLCVLDVTYTP